MADEAITLDAIRAALRAATVDGVLEDAPIPRSYGEAHYFCGYLPGDNTRIARHAIEVWKAPREGGLVRMAGRCLACGAALDALELRGLGRACNECLSNGAGAPRKTSRKAPSSTDACSNARTDAGVHRWSVSQSERYFQATGYDRRIGIRCLYCGEQWYETEAEAIVRWEALRRRALKRGAARTS